MEKPKNQIIFGRIRESVATYFESPRKIYEQRVYNNMPKLLNIIRKGDVVLVEGRSEISRFIKLFTNSNWSHIAMYIGDELIKKKDAGRDKYLTEFGGNAGHLLIEAFTGKGVIATPLKYYQNYNIRICRPYGINGKDLESVVDKVIRNLGRHYDNQNILDIALMLIPFRLNPFKEQTIKACLGRCNEFQVICSGMIAKAFQSVGYPIIPALQPQRSQKAPPPDNPYGSKLIMRHYSQVLPRDFDISPNFEIIKYNIVGSEKFDYKSLWLNDVSVSVAGKEKAA